jgi:hypothetical protein
MDIGADISCPVLRERPIGNTTPLDRDLRVVDDWPRLGGAWGAMSIMRVLAACAAMTLCAACDSFRGAQEPLEPPATQVASIARNFPVEGTIDAFYSPNPNARGGLSQQDYRDKVVALRLIAIDARYQAFVQELRGARAGVGLGADIATLVLGGVGTFVGGTTAKSVLAAATAVIAGSRVSFDKNLFYDQTLPALLAQMDAERMTQLLVIRKGLAKPVALYTLPDALVDLGLLERLGSVETAIKRITETATTKAKTAEVALQNFTLTRSLADQQFTASADGIKLKDTLIKAIDSLDGVKAVFLAIKPPVQNETADQAVAAMIPTGASISANQARFILRMRILNAQGEKELQAWAAAFK